MGREALPQSVAVFQSISEQLEACGPIFDGESKYFAHLKQSLKNGSAVWENSSFSKNVPAVLFLQTLSLLLVSMADGYNAGLIGALNHSEKGCRIHWKNRLNSAFSWGKSDRELRLHFQVLTAQLFGKKKADAVPNREFFVLGEQTLTHYLSEMDAIKSSMERLLNAHSLQNVSPEKKESELLFMVLAALPAETLNTFYLDIQEVIDEEMSIKSAKGHDVNVRAIFQVSSQDINFLMEKIKVHFNLHFYGTDESIRTELYPRSVETLNRLLRLPDVQKETEARLKESLETDFSVRIQLFTLYRDTIKQLLG